MRTKTATKENWKMYELGKAVEVVKNTWKPDEEDTKYIGLEHINQGDLTLNGVGSSKDLGSNKFRFSSGDILFGKLRPYFRKVVKVDFDGVCSTDIWVMQAKEGFNQDYIFYFLASPTLIDSATGASTGTRMPRANWNYLAKTEWLFPDEKEQKEIASILSSLEKKIELLREQNETLEQIAQTLFNEWFVEFNFPNKQGEPYKTSGGKIVESELGKIPEGWEVKGFSEIAEFLNGLALQKYPPKNKEDELPVIKIRELRSGITEQTDKASREDLPEQYLIKDGDLLFSWSGSLEVAIWKYGEGALNQHLFKVTSEKYQDWFLYLWLLHHLPFFRSIAANKATTMGHIQRFHLDQAKVFIPDENVLSEMNEVISPIFEKIIANNSQVSELVSMREFLLPKLVTGEVGIISS